MDARSLLRLFGTGGKTASHHMVPRRVWLHLALGRHDFVVNVNVPQGVAMPASRPRSALIGSSHLVTWPGQALSSACPGALRWCKRQMQIQGEQT